MELHVLLYKRGLRVAQTTCRLDFSSTRSLGRDFPAAAWEGSSADDTRHSVARRCSTGSGGDGKVGPAASIPVKEDRNEVDGSSGIVARDSGLSGVVWYCC